MNLELGIEPPKIIGKAVKEAEKSVAKKMKWALLTLKKRVPGWVIKGAGTVYNVTKRDFESVKINPASGTISTRQRVNIQGETLEDLVFRYKSKRKPVVGLLNSLKRNRVKIKKTAKDWPMSEKKKPLERTADWIFGGYRITTAKKAKKESANVQYIKLKNGIAQKTKLKMLAFTAKDSNGKWRVNLYKTLPLTFMLQNAKVKAYYENKITETLKKKLK